MTGRKRTRIAMLIAAAMVALAIPAAPVSAGNDKPPCPGSRGYIGPVLASDWGTAGLKADHDGDGYICTTGSKFHDTW